MTNLINLGGGNTDFYIGDKQARIYLGETLLYPLDTPEEGQYHLSDFSRDASDASSLKNGDKVIIVWAGENMVNQTIDTDGLSSYLLAPQGGYLKNLASYNNDNNTGKGPTPSDDEFIDAAVWEVARKGDEMALRNVKTGLWMYNDDEAHKGNHRVTFSSDPYYFTVGRLKIGDAVSFTVTSNSTIEVNNYYHYNYDFEWYETGTAGGNIFLFYRYNKNYLAKINDSIEIPCNDNGILDEKTVDSYKVSIESVEFGDCLKVIGVTAFDNCPTLKGSLVIPDSVTEIGMNAFLYDRGLTGTLEIPESISIINNGTFKACGFDALILPASITSIGEEAFYACSDLKSIKIKATAPPELAITTSFNTGPFDSSDCPIYVPCESVEAYKAAPNWSKYADRIQGWDFDNDRECASQITATTIYYTDGSELKVDDSETALGPDLVTDYGAHDLTDIKSAEIGPNIDQFLNNTFNNASNLESVKFAENSKIGKINNYSFRNCTSLKEIDMSSCKELGIIGDSAMNGCKMLTKIILPDTLYGYTIGRSIATNALALEEVVIGSGCISIGNAAFAKWGNGTAYKVIMHDTTPPTVGTYVFDNSSTAYEGQCTIYVPDSAVDDYKSSWSDYASQIHPISEL